VDALPVQAIDAALHGPRPTGREGLILLSHRGTKQFTSRVLERARGDGAAIVVISGLGSPGADIETTPQERSSAYTASHTGTMIRLAQIAVALGADLGPLDTVPDAVAAVVDGPPIGVAPPRRSLEFIGAGPNQWTAAEGALKVRETAYVAASGMNVEQYLHGPSVAPGADDTLICLNGGGPGQERLLAVARSAESCRVTVRVITMDQPSELLSVFPLTAAVQKIALETAERLGTNPDSFGRDVPSRAHAMDGISL
jgi:glucosamine--fructose-6-phosphate aminotransferase (isomerizing)